ncbi:hypothetical protein IAG44_36040 [Streptomyces roseirectus]|uniref:Uncharacterized protein n=1 Tax=Streptomyces roseirectus TaxID=2768066 RepID=A0A7H0INH4_9ACTN|nr:hypothetical protein [Streptomyces roseirectus]QNP74340.1 hypothetical protein IAG44_36040 [Streptomyces roseirectus]
MTVPRRISYTEPSTTTMFSPLQLRPRTLLGHVASGLSRWLAEYVTPFPSMVDTYGSAVVVTSVRIDYATPCPGFSDAPWLTVQFGLRVHPSGKWMHVEIDCTADGRPVAHVSTTMRVLAVADGDSLSASPGVLHPELRKAFTPAETVATPPPPDPYPAGATAVLPPREWRTFISRSHAEVADQWSFIEMIELATQARDRLFAEGLHAPLPPRQVIGTPTRTLRAVFRRPMFVYDPCVVTTSAHHGPDASGLYFHHRIGPPDSTRPHLTVWETLEAMA